MLAELRHYVDDEVHASDDATWRQELPNRGALHALILKIQMTNGATGGRGVNMLDVIDEIKIIGDGSEVLFQLYPSEHEKWYEALTKQELPMVEDQQAAAVQEIVLPIMFGRRLFDPNLWLPLGKFKDVTLEVEYSPNIAADGGFATGTFTTDILLLTTPEDSQLSYNGTLVKRRIRSFTSALSGEEEIELPGNSIIRAVGVYAYEAGIADGTDITDIDFEDKSSGKSYFAAGWDDFIHYNQQLFGCEINHHAVLLLANDEVWNSRIGEVLNYSVEEFDTPDPATDNWNIARVDAITGDELTFALANADITAASEILTDQTADVTLKVTVTGKSPSYFGLIPFNHEDQPSAWLDTGGLGKPTVILTQGGAGASIYVSVQEYKRF